MSDIAGSFGAQAGLAARLLAAIDVGTDGSHDRSHLLRVWRNACAIADQIAGADQTATADRAVLAAAVILHDCVTVEKNSPQRSAASRLSASRARTILATLGWCAEDIGAAAHAIEAHSFSAGIAPRTLEARIVQDADRLDAIGAVGIARCFYVAGRIGSSLYDHRDPAAVGRDLDDGRFALDHFGAKLFRTVGQFQTAQGAELAEARTRTMRLFVDALLAEIGDANG